MKRATVIETGQVHASVLCLISSSKHIHLYICTYMHMYTHIDIDTHRHRYIQTERQTDIQTDRHTYAECLYTVKNIKKISRNRKFRHIL